MNCRVAEFSPTAVRARTLSTMAVLPLLLVFSGCSADKKDGPPSVFDSLAEVDKQRGSSSTPPGSPPDPGVQEAVTMDNADPASEGSFKVKFETSAGDFVMLVHRDWAPIGAERFHRLVSEGYYDECRFFRVVPGFMVQFGIHGDPGTSQKWDRNILDDPVKQSNRKGYVTYAKTGAPNSRTTQIFINYTNNKFLDSDGFAPFAEIVDGMNNVEAIFSGYGEQPDQTQIQAVGNSYLKSNFPDLDFVKKASIIEESAEAPK